MIQLIAKIQELQKELHDTKEKLQKTELEYAKLRVCMLKAMKLMLGEQPDENL
jgi:hypothetical protein